MLWKNQTLYPKKDEVIVVQCSFFVSEKGVPIIAIRNYWGVESSIYRAIENAFVIRIIDHMFLCALQDDYDFDVTPERIENGENKGQDGSCVICKHQLKKALSGCHRCTFVRNSSAHKEKFNKMKDFENFIKDFKNLEPLEKIEPIRIVQIMHNKGFEHIYSLYTTLSTDHIKKIEIEHALHFISNFFTKDDCIIYKDDTDVLCIENNILYEFAVDEKNINSIHLRSMSLEEVLILKLCLDKKKEAVEYALSKLKS